MTNKKTSYQGRLVLGHKCLQFAENRSSVNLPHAQMWEILGILSIFLACILCWPWGRDPRTIRKIRVGIWEFLFSHLETAWRANYSHRGVPDCFLQGAFKGKNPYPGGQLQARRASKQFNRSRKQQLVGAPWPRVSGIGLDDFFKGLSHRRE